MRNFEVVIVQSGFSLEDYLSVEAFHKKVENLFNAAFADTFVNAKSDNRESYGTIVVFPELVSKLFR